MIETLINFFHDVKMVIPFFLILSLLGSMISHLFVVGAGEIIDKKLIKMKLIKGASNWSSGVSSSLPNEWYNMKKLTPLVLDYYKYSLYRIVFFSLSLSFAILSFAVFFSISIKSVLLIFYVITFINLFIASSQNSFKWSRLSIFDWTLIFLLPIIYVSYLLKYYQDEIGGFCIQKYKDMEKENT